MIFFTGFLIGVVSLIPGISGGTILVIMKKYDEVAKAISNIKQKGNKVFILKLILGVILGTITFARIIELLFYFIPNYTLLLFSGFVLFSVPELFHSEKIKPNLFWFVIGTIIIFMLSSISINPTHVIIDYPKITILFLIYFAFCGMIDGFFTILPGISGSMIMMILGPYFLYKSFLANLNFGTLIFILPLIFYLVGDMLGFYLGSKFSLYFLKKHRIPFMSLIVGMVLMSSLIIIPFNSLDISKSLIYIIILILSYIIVQFLNLITK